MAYKIVFTATDGMKHERKAMQIWTVKGDNAYLITYKAEPGQYSKYLPTIQKWLIHFDLLNEIILLPIWYAASVNRRQTLLRKERKGKTAGRRWNKTTE